MTGGMTARTKHFTMQRRKRYNIAVRDRAREAGNACSFLGGTDDRSAEFLLQPVVAPGVIIMVMRVKNE